MKILILIFAILFLGNCFVSYSQESLSENSSERILTNNTQKQKPILHKRFEMVRKNTDGSIDDNLQQQRMRDRFRSPYMKKRRANKLGWVVDSLPKPPFDNLKRKANLTTDKQQSSLSPTEVWRIRGQFRNAVYNDDGSIYLSKYYEDVYRDRRLMKISSTTGETIWEKRFFSDYYALYTSKGVYIIKWGVVQLNPDTLVYIDNNGTVIWEDNLLRMVYLCNVDRKGNFYYLTSDDKLIKIDTTGVKRFEVTIPQIPIRGDVYQDCGEIIIDDYGIVWVIVYPYLDVSKDTERSSMDATYQYIYALQFNSETGAFISQKQLQKKELVWMEKEDDRENRTLIEVYNELYFENVGKNLVGFGTYNYYLEKETPRGEKYEYLTHWRIITHDAVGKTKLFKYKGKGIDKCTVRDDEQTFSYMSDEGSNQLNDLARFGNDVVYVTGTVAVGKSKCGEPALESHSVLMKFNLTNKKPDWVRTFSDQYLTNFFISPSQKLFIQTGGKTIRAFDINGNPGSVLTFNDRIIMDGYVMRSINKEDGFIYLFMKDQETNEYYFAKYLIPSLEFAASSYTPYVDEPIEFTLYQNYPEPFNPATTIRFALPEQSIVSLKVYNMLGQEVATLIDQQIMEEGEHEVEFYADKLASGVYFYRIFANGISDEGESTAGNKFMDIKKMLLIK